MSRTSDRTKNLRLMKFLFSSLHYIFMFVPLIVFVVMGYVEGTSSQKVTLSLTVTVGLILGIISIFISVKNKAGLHRTILWVVIIGISFCLSKVETFVYVMAMTSIIDEVLLVNLKDRYTNLLTINKEIDKR